MKKSIVKTLFGLVLLSLTVSCDISDPGPDPLQDINSIFIGEQILDFKSAKLTITGPANITAVNSHVRASLDLYSESDFEEPFAAGSNGLTIALLSVNNGFDLPKFPLVNGTYDVFPTAGFPNPEVIGTLDGTSFAFGPGIGISYDAQQGTFGTMHDASVGVLQIVFDIASSRVRLDYDYLTSDGTRVTGSNNLPLNLSSFTP